MNELRWQWTDDGKLRLVWRQYQIVIGKNFDGKQWAWTMWRHGEFVRQMDHFDSWITAQESVEYYLED